MADNSKQDGHPVVYAASRIKRIRATRDKMEARASLPERLTREELAAFWRVSVRTIERREAVGIGPKPIRLGARVLYRREDVLAFEQAQIDRAAG
jgi:transcriptional regulator GlxA family with amidase domain